MEVVVEAGLDGTFSFVVTEGFCSSWQRCAISLLMLSSERNPRVSADPPGNRKKTLELTISDRVCPHRMSYGFFCNRDKRD